VSLIDEALKRAQEASRRQGEPERARPWSPPPLPDAGLARRRAIARALGIGAGVIAGLAAVGVLGWIVWNAAASEKTASPVAPAATRAVAAAAPTPEPTLPETIVSKPPSANAASGVPASPAPIRAPATASVNGAAQSPRTDAQPSVPAPAPAPAVASQPKGLSDGRTYIRVVELPEGGRIELGGIVWSEEEPRALLNDRIVAVDGYVEGFTVSKIDENRVVLTRDGMTIYLAVK
jgi:hypothetical protein